MKASRIKSKRRRKGNGAAKQKPSTAARAGPADQVVAAAEGHLERGELVEARALLEQVLTVDADNMKAGELLATLLLESGRLDEARALLQRAVDLQPLLGHAKYFSLAQLNSGAEACALYRRGIAVARDVTDSAEVRRDISDAYCSLTELFMTDLCDEPDAETSARDCVQQALAVDDANPEAHKCQADLLLVLGDVAGARAAIRRSTSLWLPQHQLAREGDPTAGPLHVCPVGYDSRLSCARALLECEEWETAGEVLEGLVEEDDSRLDVWYLLGLTHYEQGREHYGTARYYWRRAVAVASAAAAAAGGDEAAADPGDQEVLQHIEQLLAEIGCQTGDEEQQQLQQQEEEDEESDQGGEDEWTDDEEMTQDKDTHMTNT